MNKNQTWKDKDFSNSGRSEKETFYQRQINERNENHMDEELIDTIPVDYSRYHQNDIIQESYLADDEGANYNGQIDDYKSEYYQSLYGKNSGRFPRPLRQNSDQVLEAKVIEALKKESDINASGIKVWVNKGTVILSGTVISRDDRFKAEMAIENINGIEDIQNNLAIGKIDLRH